MPRRAIIWGLSSTVRRRWLVPVLVRGFVLGERDVGYELRIWDDERLDSPVSARRDLHLSGEARLGRDGVVDVACCGMSGNMKKNQG